MLCKFLLQRSNVKLFKKRVFESKNMHLQFGKNWKYYKFLLDSRKLDIQNPKTLKLGYFTMNKEALQKFEALTLDIDWNIAEKLMLEKNRDLEPPFCLYLRYSSRWYCRKRPCSCALHTAVLPLSRNHLSEYISVRMFKNNTSENFISVILVKSLYRTILDPYFSAEALFNLHKNT